MSGKFASGSLLVLWTAGAVAHVGGCGSYSIEQGNPGNGLAVDVAANFGPDVLTDGPGADGKPTSDAGSDSSKETDGVDADGTGPIDALIGSVPDAASDPDSETDPVATDVQPVDEVPQPPACESKACAKAADCPDSVLACQESACVGGCCVDVLAAETSSCDDGNACTVGDACKGGACKGTAKSCQDGLACTDDACLATGACEHVLQANWCQIDGACTEHTKLHASNPCKWCDVAKTTTAWSVKPGCCTKDNQCPSAGICDVAICEIATGKCKNEKKLGCCTQDGECDDGSPCTIDACNVLTGACEITPKTCAAPTSCQNGVCDAKTGACVPQLKPGHCIIDDKCQTNGETSAANPCLVCTAALDTKKWSASAGVFCNDGDVCTFSDVCTEKGQCQGKLQQGCCKGDGDCPPPGDACQVLKCNVATHVCTSSDKPGCCTSGVCCDVQAQVVKVAKASCGASVLSTEYHCSGNTIEKRETHPGCNGVNADGCSAQFASTGPWQGVQACPSNTACKEVGSAQMPKCEATGPVGSCQGSCGKQSSSGTCHCDSLCSGYKDCCKDFMPLCGCSSGECCDLAKSFPKSSGTACGSVKTEFQCNGNSIQKRTGQATCAGSSACSGATVWGGWTTIETCSNGSFCVASGTASAICKAPPAGSCNGKCGGKSADACWCDKACVDAKDCCSDYAAKNCASITTCGVATGGSCKGKCGVQGSGACWCDAACTSIGDCCGDKQLCNCTP